MSSHSSRRSRRFRRSRGTHLRTKVVALLLSLIALWGFAAFVTLREGLNLLWVSTLTDHVGRPTESLLAALQQERRLSAVFVASSGGPSGPAEQRRALLDQRQKTDEALATFRRQTRGTTVSWAGSDALEARIGQLGALLDGLPRQRNAVDAGSAGSAASVTGMYTGIIDAGFRVYGSISGLDDPDIAKQSRTLVALSRARELLSQEDALLAGIIAAGRFTGGEHAQFVRLVGAQRFAYGEAAAELAAPERANYERVANGDAMSRLRAAEDRVIDSGRAASALPIDGPAWSGAVESAVSELRALELTSADLTLQRAKPAAVGVIVRLVLAGGLGLIAVIASIIISITTARSLLRQLVRLRDAAHSLAHHRLPAVVAQLRRGDTVDVDAEAPPLEFGDDEIGQVGQAFNAVQRTAVQAAVEQAELRKSVRDVFVSLARRTQTLVHRQLRLLDQMERHETDATELAVLFRVDHLATRMRRNAENLIVLSGSVSGRGWRHSVPMVDVIRGAAAEIEDYTRVTVLPIAPAGLHGRVIGDVIHLLAELIENAAAFSPPHTVVHVGGQLVGTGFAVEIEDRGLGMSDAALADANAQLRNPPEFHLSSTARLGLYVVGRLAERHGIGVQLRRSPYGGITAIVLIPSVLVDDQSAETPVEVDPLGSPSPLTGPVRGSARAAWFDTVVAPDDPEPAERTGAAQPLSEPGAWPPVSPAALAGRHGGDGPSLAPLTALPAQREAADADDGEPVPATVFGLPRRRRRPAPGSPAEVAQQREPADGAVKARSPEEVRDLMSAYQTGTLRARSDAGQPIPALTGSLTGPLSEPAGEQKPPVETGDEDS